MLPKTGICAVALGVVSLVFFACGARNESGGAAEGAAGGSDMGEIQVYDFSDHFVYDAINVLFDAPEYELPLKEDDIAGFDLVTQSLGLSQEAEALLLKNGFVVTQFSTNPWQEDILQAYKALQRLEIPTFVTSGSLLHAYHILFDDLLRTTESRYLYDDLWALSLGLFEHCQQIQQESRGELKEAARRGAVFFGVGLSLLKPTEGQVSEPPEAGRWMSPGEVTDFVAQDLRKYEFEVPSDIADEVARELDLVGQHEGFQPSPLFKYEEDYSQYVPRGHYTRTEKLKNYFRAMMWFGRMTMLLKGTEEVKPGETCRTCGALVSEYDARIQTLAAVIIASRMRDDRELLGLWERIYKVTSFFVGFSDDLGPYEYIEAVQSVLSGEDLFAALDAETYGRLKAKLAEYRSPLIYGGTGDCMILPPFKPEQADTCLAKTRGFRFMGQRFVPDSYVMSKLVAPYTGEFMGGELPFTAFSVPGLGVARVFPRGLDLMASLGSVRALEILDEVGDRHYEDFDKAFGETKAEVDAIKQEDWNQNLYWNWLWSLKGLLSEFGSGYPTFMQTQAWKDRLITLTLASWAELRHDTILYVKQSYTLALGAAPEPVRGGGYVEPVPEFYNRLLSLTRMTRSGLREMGLLDDDYARRLKELESTLERLIGISLAELKGEKVDPSDSMWIADFADVMDSVVGDLADESLKSTIVADVHTDPNSSMVLEEASGYVDLMVVAWRGSSGVSLAAGPELSYYEFKQPMSDRLTDDAWRAMLKSAPPERPTWVRSYLR